MELQLRIVAASAICCCLCFFTSCAITEAVSQKLPPSKPIIYVDLPRWEDRTAYPRFIQFRDHLRRRLDETPRSIGSSAEAILSVPNESAIRLPEDKRESLKVLPPAQDDESLEILLAERNGFGTEGKTAPDKLISSHKDEHKKSLPDSSPTSTNSNASKNFLTSNQRHSINFPKDRTNPYNRLQLHKDSTNASNVDSSEGVSPTSSAEPGSLEVGDRHDFLGNNNLISDSSTPNVKDAVNTVDLTMSILKFSLWEDENALFSPLSIATVLSMLLLGADGTTFKELSSQLSKHDHLETPMSLSTKRYHEAFSQLLEHLNAFSGTDVKLSVASELFVDKRFTIDNGFRQQLQSYYNAPTDIFDFGKEGQAFLHKVNHWVREKTHNKIKSILDEPPSPRTTLGIVNAVYFKGPWELPFSEKLTRWKDFRVSAEETIKAEMMLNIVHIPFVQRESFRMIALPYKQNRTGFFVILPNGNEGIDSLKSVENILTKEELYQSFAEMKRTKVAVTLPKLKFSSDGQMHEVLKNMGLSSLFHPSTANLSGMSSDALYISSLLHRAVVEVNEVGTEAAAVSIGTGDRIIDDLPVSFVCDKPFIFFIYHVNADTVLFWARVIRPDRPTI